MGRRVYTAAAVAMLAAAFWIEGAPASAASFTPCGRVVGPDLSTALSANVPRDEADHQPWQYLVLADLKRRTETTPKVFKIQPEYFRPVRPRCVAQPRSAPARRTPSGDVSRIAGCKAWTCTQWYAPLNCCIRWECSPRVFR